MNQAPTDLRLGQDWQRTSSGLYVPPHVRPHSYGDFIGIDLFAGAGGFSLGFMQAGARVVAAVEWDVDCCLTYLHNLGTYPVEIHFIEPKDRDRLEKAIKRNMKRRHKGQGLEEMILSGHGWIKSERERGNEVLGVPHFFFGDIRKITGREILDALGLGVGDVDCVFGGPPCQGFSIGNTRRKVMDPRNSLVFKFARLVLEMRPKTMCMENVPGILSMVTPEGTPVIDALCRILEDGGFGKYETLRRSLLATAGLHPGAAMRGKTASDVLAGDADNDPEEEEAPRLPGFE